jgi:hypothetical protein
MKKVLLALLVVGVVTVAAGAATWKLSPSARELVYLAGLFSGVDAIEAECASALVDYPTSRAALGLIAYTNLQYRPPFDGAFWRRVFDRPRAAADPVAAELARMLEGWGCLEKGAGPKGLRNLDGARKIEASECAQGAVADDEVRRKEEAQVASRAVWTLCRMSGHDFGTDCDPEARGILASTLSDREWHFALNKINAFGMKQFGGVTLDFVGGTELNPLKQVLQASYQGPR